MVLEWDEQAHTGVLVLFPHTFGHIVYKLHSTAYDILVQSLASIGALGWNLIFVVISNSYVT